jgi:2-(1,2-epoxy-1,2-dihydrophenyl)acetyl-CoA isomerase
MSDSPLLVERQEKVAVLTMNRPESLNALNRALQDAIGDTCEELRNDDSVWAVVLTGAGRGFCSGADLRGGRPEGDDAPSRQERLDVYGWVGRLAMAIYRRLDKPIIAAVNGVAAGAGMSVALACDMRVGSEKTRFKTVFIERSLSPDSGMSFFLPRIVGHARACDLVFTSRSVDADEAYRLGLLDRLVPSEKLLEEAVEVANQIAFWPPVAMQSARRVLQQSMESTLEEQLRNESFGLNFARRAPNDAKESRDSFVEKRPPRFTGQ